MKDYDESEAIAMMLATLAKDRRNDDAAYEVLDLIYDYYEENGELDINMDEDDSETDFADMTSYIAKQLKRHPAEVDFTVEEIEAMIRAEVEYEDSLQ
ncbi:MAG: hypothetical protein J6C95_04630 [Muribaculaceae bacterium]|nr:hypothetical protein [Muribaculaceae bacterium]